MVVRLGVLLLLLTACGPASEAPPADTSTGGADRVAATVREARVAESVNGRSMSVYGIVEGGSADDALVGLRPAFEAVGSLHAMEEDGGMMTMSEIDRIDVPAGGSVELRPGMLHGMLEELGDVPAVGDTLRLTFVFASGIEVEVRAPVLSMAEIAAGGAAHAH